MKIKCWLANLKAGLIGVPPFPLMAAGVPLVDRFSASSRQGTSIGVELDFNPSRLDAGHVKPTAQTDTQWLTSTLIDVMGPPKKEKEGVDEIALVFADYWIHDREWAFGVMFDVGFDPKPGSKVVSRGRRGAAVFLDTIWKQRGQEGVPRLQHPAYCSEVAFVIAHELGHVFNLWHSGPGADDHAASFMTTSRQKAVFPDGAFHFDDRAPTGSSFLRQTDFLARCGDSEFVQPGGSRFGNRGPLGPNETVNLNQARSDDRIRLRISVPRAEFWRFEPIQLDLKISLTNGSRSRASIPNEIDPAFSRFDLWITEPSGARRTYRSPVHLCPTPTQRTITRDDPFQRDLPVFGQSGGYTFTEAGPHVLQAVLRLGRHRIVASNKIEVNVLPAMTTRQYRILKDVLKSRDAAQLLFYGSTSRPPERTNLELLIQSSIRHPAVADARYGLARAQLAAARGFVGRNRARARALALSAREHFGRVSQAASLGAHRQEKAVRYRGEASAIAEEGHEV